LKNTHYVHVTSEEDLKGKDKSDHFLLLLDNWRDNRDNEALREKAERFKVINKDRFEKILKGLPDNDRL
jgi:hypothetical protein